MIIIKNKIKIAIINYEISNLFSIHNALTQMKYDCVITKSIKEIKSSDIIILPGVGAYSKAIDNLKKLKIYDLIYSHIINQKPTIGICLGMQLLFESSEEFGNTDGFGVIEGKVISFVNNGKKKIIRPHMGWNDVILNKKNIKFSSLSNIRDNFDRKKFYFVHSLFAKPKNQKEILTFTKYYDYYFCSSILTKNIFACQFHPEKSGKNGLKLINFFIKSMH